MEHTVFIIKLQPTSKAATSMSPALRLPETNRKTYNDLPFLLYK